LLALGGVVALVAVYLTGAPLGPGPGGSGNPSTAASQTPAAGWTIGPSLLPDGSPGTTVTPSTGPPQPVALGVYVPGAPGHPSTLDAFTKLTGAAPKVVMWYQAWVGPYAGFIARDANAVRARGAMPMISWEPSAGKAVDATWALARILDGSHDAYIRRWATAVAAWRHPLYVRLMYEMNGPWSPWGKGVNGNAPGQFAAAWRHIVDIVRAQGATNIRWVWCPNIDPNQHAGPYSDYYPGDRYVDWVGLDGFNWGTSTTDVRWRDIGTIFKGPIAQLRALTSKPLLIGETAANAGPDKAAWISEGLAGIPTALPEVRAVVWYDRVDAKHGADWRVDSSTDALRAFGTLARSSAFAGHLP
jgi:hypothetical protein